MTDQIKFEGDWYDVEYDHQPEEAEVTHCGDGSGYPGCAERYDIIKIELDGVDVTGKMEADMERHLLSLAEF